MKHFRRVVSTLAAVVVMLVTVPGVSAETNINFLLGAKALDSEDWDPGEGQGELAVMTTFGPEKWPVQIALDLLGTGTSDETFRQSTLEGSVRGFSLTQSTVEFDFGVRKIWQKGKARPFVGGGIASIWATQERLLRSPPGFGGRDPFLPERPDILPFGVVSDTDNGVGGWIDGGIFWRLTRRFNLGLEARLSGAKVTLHGEEVQAGGSHFGLVLGFGF